MFYQINVIEDPLHFNLVCPFYRDISVYLCIIAIDLLPVNTIP